MRLWLLIPPMLASGCATGSLDAFCAAAASDAAAHAAALVDDGGDLSVVTGQNLISRMDAACSHS